MIFARANRQEVAVIRGILEKYLRWFGQMVNYGKLTLFCSDNTHPDLAAALCDAL